MLREIICLLALVGAVAPTAYAGPSSNVVMVDVVGFRAEHVLRGRRAAEEDIRAGRLGFYLGSCSFPGPSKKDHRKFKRQKEYLLKLGVQPRKYDKCHDLIDEAKRFEAFVEGYNSISSVEISKRTGKEVAF